MWAQTWEYTQETKGLAAKCGWIAQFLHPKAGARAFCPCMALETMHPEQFFACLQKTWVC